MKSLAAVLALCATGAVLAQAPAPGPMGNPKPGAGPRASGPEEEPTQARRLNALQPQPQTQGVRPAAPLLQAPGAAAPAAMRKPGTVACGDEEEGAQPRARAAGKPLTPQGPLARPDKGDRNAHIK